MMAVAPTSTAFMSLLFLDAILLYPMYTELKSFRSIKYFSRSMRDITKSQ